MATWAEINSEIDLVGTQNSCDVVRRRKLSQLKQITGRNTLIYAADFLGQKARIIGGNELSINLNDKEGFIEVTKNLQGPNIDVILHSPGGSAEAAESIADLLRAKFSNIRFIIPNAAKSAATILAMSGDMLLMDDRSELGPTDPQMIVNRDGHIVNAPAHDIKTQFELAKKDISKNPQNMASWLPILRQYGPSLLAQCDTSMKLSQKLVSKWLKKYMFSGDTRAGQKAARVATYLTSKTQFQSHARKVGIEDLTSRDVKILDLRTDTSLQNAVWDVYLTLSITFQRTGAYKLFENDLEEALILQIQPVSPGNQQAGPTRMSRPTQSNRLS